MVQENQAPEPELTADEIQAAVFERMRKYEALNFLEHFGLFMGLAQVLELHLKQLLNERCGTTHDSMERWTLGKTARALRRSGLRRDFCELLDSLVEDRNHIAHELLANEMMLRQLAPNVSSGIEVRALEKATYELEQLMFLYDLCDAHSAWD